MSDLHIFIVLLMCEGFSVCPITPPPRPLQPLSLFEAGVGDKVIKLQKHNQLITAPSLFFQWIAQVMVPIFSISVHQTLCSAVVQVYGAERSYNWVKKCCGVACLVKDNPQRSYFIKVFDIKVSDAMFTWKLICKSLKAAVSQYINRKQDHEYTSISV